jgi:hypothetical protein
MRAIGIVSLRSRVGARRAFTARIGARCPRAREAMPRATLRRDAGRRGAGTSLAPRRIEMSTHRRIRGRRIVLASVACAIEAFLARAPAARANVVEEPSPVAFTRDTTLSERAEVRAVAVEPGSGRLAFGDGRAVWLRTASGGAHAVLRRGPVTALAFAQGALLVGTERGLWVVDEAGRAREASPGPGSTARLVHALAVVDDVWLAATDDGAFVAAAGGSWQRLDGGLPARPALAIAAHAGATGPEIDLVVDGEPWHAALERTAERIRVAAVRRESGALAGAERGGFVDAVNAPDGSLVLASADALAVRSAAGAWRALRPTMPPGTAIARIGFGLGHVWLATDRGLLVAPALDGPWQRAAFPAGGAAVRSLADGGAFLAAGGAEGLLLGRLAAEATPPGVGASALWDRDAHAEEPRVEAVQRAALAYLDLGPERVAALRDGAARRGLLPVLGLHFTRTGQKTRHWGEDQSFVSGATRQLEDRDRDHDRDWGLGVTLEWDLGDAAYHPEEVDVLHESREVIELRDDVLDEITQLYFERRRVLLELANAGDAPPLEQARLRLRADELAAGLDAWTGGWFGRHARRLAEPSHPWTPFAPTPSEELP